MASDYRTEAARTKPTGSISRADFVPSLPVTDFILKAKGENMISSAWLSWSVVITRTAWCRLLGRSWGILPPGR